jgi:hypothetical protein
MKINIFYFQIYSSSIQKIKKKTIDESEKPLWKLNAWQKNYHHLKEAL